MKSYKHYTTYFGGILCLSNSQDLPQNKATIFKDMHFQGPTSVLYFLLSRSLLSQGTIHFGPIYIFFFIVEDSTMLTIFKRLQQNQN